MEYHFAKQTDSACHLGHACGGFGFRLKETHFPERKYEEYFEKSIVSPAETTRLDRADRELRIGST